MKCSAHDTLKGAWWYDDYMMSGLLINLRLARETKLLGIVAKSPLLFGQKNSLKRLNGGKSNTTRLSVYVPIHYTFSITCHHKSSPSRTASANVRLQDSGLLCIRA
jgi:hypothetical protein